MSYEPYHHKYRPQTFADLVGQEAIATTLTNAIQQERIAPAYLFSGPRGTGKTSSARIFAKSLNCLASKIPTQTPCGRCEACRTIATGDALDVIEIDAASNTGVDNIRDLIEKAQFAPVQCRYKVYIIDEVHMLSVSAFNCLLKILEEPPKQVVFILATTDPQRVLATIISRCQRFDFRRIPLDAMVNHLRKIASIENININDEALTIVGQVAQGGLRDAESLLDQLSLLACEVTVERVWDLVGAVPERDLMTMLEAIASDRPEAVLDCTRQLLDRGREPLTVLQNLAGFYRDLLIAKTAPNRHDLVACTAMTWKELCEFARKWEISIILTGQEHLRESEVQIKNTTQPRLWLEVTLLGLLPEAIVRQNQVQTNPDNRRMEIRDRPAQIVTASIPVKITTPANNISPTTLPPSIKNGKIDFVQESIISKDTDTINHQSSETPVEEKLPEPVQNNGNYSINSEEKQAIEPANLSYIWQQTLDRFELPFDRSLFSDNCHLLNFERTSARVGITKPGLLGMVQSRLAKIEAAFEAFFQRKIKVNLEVITATETKTDTAKEMRSPNGANPISSAPPKPKTTEPVLGDREAESKNISHHPLAETVAEDIQPLPPSILQVSELPDTSLEPDNTIQVPELELKQVAKATKRLAEFFKGEVIKMSDDLDFGIPSDAIDLPNNSQRQYSEPTARFDTEVEEWQDDDDVDF